MNSHNLLICQPLNSAFAFLTEMKKFNFKLILWDYRFIFFPTPNLIIESRIEANNPPNFRLMENIDLFLFDFEENLSYLKQNLKNFGFIAILINGTLKFKIKSILDKVLGISTFLNEILLDSPYQLSHDSNRQIFERTDYILLYGNPSNQRVNPVYNDRLSGGYWHSFVSKGQGSAKIFVRDGKKIEIAPPPGTHWKLKQETILKFCQEGLIRFNSSGNPEYWVKEKRGQIIDTNWLDIDSFDTQGNMICNSKFLYKRLFNLVLKEGDQYLNIFSSENTSIILANSNKNPWVKIYSSEVHLKPEINELKGKGLTFEVYQDNPFSIPSSNHHHKISSPPHEINADEKDIENPTLSIHELYSSQDPETVDLSKGKWINSLILGDCFIALTLIKKLFNDRIKLIYIDPPYFTGINEIITIPITPESHHLIEKFAYQNTINSTEPIQFFKKWFKVRLDKMKELLANDGHIFVRYDYHFGHYAKLVLDEVFGVENFVIELFVRRMKKNLSKKQEYHQNHLIVHTDSLFIYRKSKDAVLDLRKITKRHKNAQDIAERELHNDNLWIDITGYEKVKKSLYPTENSEVLLKRLIEISTDPGDIIADFFSGSGTTLAVSEKLKRKWIGIDIGLMSINETKRRILNLPNFQPFEISRVVDKKRSYNIDSSVPEFFLGIGGKKRLEIDKNGLGVTIELQRDYSGITLYIVHFSSQKIENFQPLTTFRYYIDTWVLDWSYNGFQIRSTWFSTRKTKGKRLIKPVETFCRFEVFNRTKIDLALLITDIFGLELNYKFKIILLKH